MPPKQHEPADQCASNSVLVQGYIGWTEILRMKTSYVVSLQVTAELLYMRPTDLSGREFASRQEYFNKGKLFVERNNKLNVFARITLNPFGVVEANIRFVCFQRFG